ncbi:solute carrier family 2, facilitated glucose transporter member 1-like isoform X2 [Harmonia axyridis]|uniref:solute carrier family 2, facilitated glucose transporter member 1-like isoform X2 n=1 Tax=Harmonia axyridis TaxID=115357 RepID=UPI001E277AB9|nr:solute carrier family 2, facilitated glucose transporter member 1-like isoform X2 [Harmonia axyridis]
MGKGGEYEVNPEKITFEPEFLNGKIKKNPKNSLGLNGKLVFAISAASLGSAFQHGYSTGVMNNPQMVLQKWMKEVLSQRNGEEPDSTTITLLWSVIISIYCVGGMIGGLITGLIAEKLGRKIGLLFSNIFIILAAICTATAKPTSSIELIIISRFLTGLNAGLNAGITPMYLAEISPTNLRGAVGSVYQLVITISILVSQILGIRSVFGNEDSWPILLTLILIPCIFQLATFPFCPESPKHLLISKGQEVEAQRALIWLRCTHEVHEEMEQMKSEAEAMKLVPKVTVIDLIVNGALRQPLIISLMVMLAQQLSGINAVINFSTDIFTTAGLSETNSTGATMGIGLVNVLMTLVSVVLIERAGRKTLLTAGFIGMIFSTILLTVALTFSKESAVASIFCIVFVVLYIITFATGPGSIPWFLVSELFSQSARPTAASLAVFTNWFANFLVGLTFLPIKEAIDSNVFIIFIVLQILFLIFIWKKVPETKNKSIEEISALFRQKSYE